MNTTQEETIVINPIYTNLDNTVALAVDEQDNLFVITHDDVYVAASIEDALDVYGIYADAQSAFKAWEVYRWA